LPYRLFLSSDRAVTLGDKIYIPPSIQEGTPEYEATIAHESVHYEQQKGKNFASWVAKYLANKDFRWRMESEAWEAEIKWWLEHGYFVEAEWVARALADGYGLMISYEKALDWAKAVIAKYEGG
jgi:hypothetical protein